MTTEVPEIHGDASLLGDRHWAAELFIGADAVLSALKQVHVEAGSSLELLAREAEASGRIATLSPVSLQAVRDVTYAIVEEVADGLFFLALVWASLHSGGALVASAARILVAANTWTPEKRKRLSPWRSLDAAVARMLEPEVGRPLQVEKVLDAAFRRAGVTLRSRTRVPARLSDLVVERGLTADVHRVNAAFAATACQPTRQMLDRLLRASPGLALGLANIYAGYARTAGFGDPAPSKPRPRQGWPGSG